MSDQHYVRQPKFLTYIRYAQVALSFIILALTSFAITVVPGGNAFGTFGFNVFCTLYTFIAVAYILVTPARAVQLYNCWAALVLEIFGVIFWLCGFATMASWASVMVYITSPMSVFTRDAKKKSGGSGGYSDTSDSVYGDSIDTITANAQAAVERYVAGWRCAAAAGGLGAIVWVLFMITLITFSVHLHRHRTNPANKNLPDNGSPAEDGAVGVGKGHEMGSVDVPHYGQQC
jgi:hypothetical protein